MDKTTIEEIMASLDRLNILELQQLTDVLLEKYTSNIQVISEEEIRAQEAAIRAYWTPWYSLTLTAVNCKPGNVVALIKKVREISGCSLLKAKEKVTNPEASPSSCGRGTIYTPRKQGRRSALCGQSLKPSAR